MGEQRAQVAESRYELVVKIASGGMGSVYVGRQRGAAGFSRLVAIKRAHPHLLEDPSFARLLLDEAHHASRLHHPNAVAVLDIEELDGELLLIMDYVEGASLAELLATRDPDRKPLPAGVAIRIVLDACAGLHAAHGLCDDEGRSLGLVHRDVSPHNVLVGVDGVARLSDFGIAKSVQASEHKTATGVVRGKAGYLAPEYVDGGQLDARSDIFSLGVVLWEALASKRLFRRGSEPATLHAVAREPAPRLSEAVPALGEHFDDLLEQALTKDPGSRFASAEAFRAALEREARAIDCIATHVQVGALVRERMDVALSERRAKLRAANDEPTGELRLDEPAARALGEGAGTQGALSTDMRSTDAQLVTKPSAVPRRWLWGGVALLVGVSAAVLLTVRSSGSESPPLETDATGSAAAAAASGEVELAVSTTASRSEPTASASASASAAAGAPPTASLQPPAVPTTHVVPHPRRVTPPDDPWQ